jgi:precorrin-6B methylase 2
MQASMTDFKILLEFALFVAAVSIIALHFNAYLFAVIVFSTIFIILSISQIFGALYFPSEDTVVKRMVDMARLKKGEVAYDLGSGDARILIEAARRHKNIKLVGIEVNPFLFALSKLMLKIRGLEGRVEIRRENLFNVDVKDADVIFIFLLKGSTHMLEKKLKKELRKGTRVVSHIWKFKDTKLAKADERLKVYLYNI